MDIRFTIPSNSVVFFRPEIFGDRFNINMPSHQHENIYHKDGRETVSRFTKWIIWPRKRSFLTEKASGFGYLRPPIKNTDIQCCVPVELRNELQGGAVRPHCCPSAIESVHQGVALLLLCRGNYKRCSDTLQEIVSHVPSLYISDTSEPFPRVCRSFTYTFAQVFYFPNRNPWYNLQFVCSSFLEGGRTERHSLSSYPPKYKTEIHEYYKLSTYHSRISNDIEKKQEKEESEISLRLRTQKKHTTPRAFGLRGVPSGFFAEIT